MADESLTQLAAHAEVQVLPLAVLNSPEGVTRQLRLAGAPAAGSAKQVGSWTGEIREETVGHPLHGVVLQGAFLHSKCTSHN